MITASMDHEIQAQFNAHAEWLKDNMQGQRLYLVDENFASQDLSGKDFSYATFINCNFSKANLIEANFSFTCIKDCNFHNAVLCKSSFDHSDIWSSSFVFASLKDSTFKYSTIYHSNFKTSDCTNCNFKNAHLHSINFKQTTLKNSNFENITGIKIVSDTQQRLIAVAKDALASKDTLQMDLWHTCNTTHCIAGWAIHHAGEIGYCMENEIGAPIAGLILLGPEAFKHFYDTDEQARKYLESVLESV
jgi:hypothetical protein